MLSIGAVVRPERVNQVADALLAAGCSGFYYYNVTGQGRQQGVEVIVGRAGHATTRSAVPKTVIRTVVPDGLKDAVVAAIVETAKGPGDGAIGDGKIFISPVRRRLCAHRRDGRRSHLIPRSTGSGRTGYHQGVCSRSAAHRLCFRVRGGDSARRPPCAPEHRSRWARLPTKDVTKGLQDSEHRSRCRWRASRYRWRRTNCGLRATRDWVSDSSGL